MNRTPYFENIFIALTALRAHKLRSFLTILGVIIGVMTVIVIASILTGMRSTIVSMVEDYGTENIYAFHLSTGPRMGPRDRREWQRKPLTLEDVKALRTQSTAIEDVSYFGFLWSDRTLQYGGQTYTRAQIHGTSPNHGAVSNVVLEEGRFITEADDLRRNQVCVLGISVVEALFPHYSQIVGRVITIGGNRFTVVGLLDKRKATFFGENEEDNSVFIPYRTLRKLAPRNDFLLVVVKGKEGRLAKAFDESEAILRRQRGVRFNQPNDFDLATADRFIEQFDAITAMVGLIAIAISGIGLLVGGIGVMNIMLVSVTERTREIGIRKAVGAKRRDVVSQFLFEAMTLTTLGGIIGVLVAIGISYVVMWFVPQLPAQIPLWAVLTGLLVSISVGLIFGVWPAVKAARLDPIESLRYE